MTVGGGRNSKLGHGLGRMLSVSDMMTGELRGETVEGIDTARFVADILTADAASKRTMPLATAICAAVLKGERFELDFAALYP